MKREYTAEVREALERRLEGHQRRFEHSLGCAEVAVLLAQIYGVDQEQAMLAGLLHDWDKALSVEELRSRAKRLKHKPFTNELIDSGQLDMVLHAFTGAESVKAVFPWVSDEIVAAISEHTVGSTNMDELSAILYIADTIEPTRSLPLDEAPNPRRAQYYAALEEMREAVGSLSLFQLLFLCYRYNLEWVIRSGRALYPQTAQIYNSFLAKSERS